MNFYLNEIFFLFLFIIICASNNPKLYYRVDKYFYFLTIFQYNGNDKPKL